MEITLSDLEVIACASINSKKIPDFEKVHLGVKGRYYPAYCLYNGKCEMQVPFDTKNFCSISIDTYKSLCNMELYKNG